MPRKILTGLAALVVLLVVAAVGGACWVYHVFDRAAPVYAGKLAMSGLSAPVHIWRDEYGVPHIFAANMIDAARALGYVHAGERMFQMEINRRAGAGRLSEILGPDMLGVDKFTRTLGLYRLAEDTYRTLSPEARQELDSYVAGVNDWLDSHKHSLPPQYFFLHATPEKWTAADSLVWAKLMALQLSENYKHEIMRARLLKKFPPELVAALFPPPPPGSPVTTEPHVSAAPAKEPLFPLGPTPNPRACEQNFIAAHAHQPTSFGDWVLHALNPGSASAPKSAYAQLGTLTGLDLAASNEWVIGGTRTDSGKPILANDPHLGLDLPILWYLVRIVTPQLSIEGATVPGLPVVLLGQNGHIAWGFTTTGSDVQDLFVETEDAKNRNAYLTPDGSQPFETRSEVIHVKGGPDVNLTVRATRHGPVLSDIDPEIAALAGPGKVVALSFTALAPHDATPEALMRIDRATNWQEFLDALRLYRAPPQNIAYADTAGNIGFIAAGVVPIRHKGDGSVPADGASGDYDWTGTIPFEQWPKVFNPPAGFVFNANNAVVGADLKSFYGEDWEEPYRAERLQQFFDQLPHHSLDTSTLMQADHVSLAARQLLPFLYRMRLSDTRAGDALAALRDWHGLMDCAKAEPLIFNAWLYEMHKALENQANDDLHEQGPFDALALQSILSAGGREGWCGPQQDCNVMTAKAFSDALAFVTARDGSDMKNWRWGVEHFAVLRDKFYTKLPFLKAAGNYDIPSSGDFYTLDRGGGSTDPERPFARTHGGGFRGIYDLSDPARSRFMITTGESGYPFDPHYGDFVRPWNEVKAITLSGSELDLAARKLPELVLAPKN